MRLSKIKLRANIKFLPTYQYLELNAKKYGNIKNALITRSATQFYQVFDIWNFSSSNRYKSHIELKSKYLDAFDMFIMEIEL